MKITVAPSCQPSAGQSADTIMPSVTVEHPYDDLNLDEMMNLMRSVLLACGYSEQTVKDYFDAPL